jgi:tRNA-Thr(GGU) m(6)t(6)A37 methyltransferase TsaA
MKTIAFQPIGEIHTPFKTIEDMPIQPTGARTEEGKVVIRPEFEAGLEDIDGFSHLILIYQFHLSSGYRLKVKPFLDDQERGLFATRAPRRPNAIGMSVVRLLRRENEVLYVGGIDVIDGTPLLDIKPYVPAFDSPRVTRVGWLKGKDDEAVMIRSDGRFGAPDDFFNNR